MKVEFEGAAREVTGSQHLVEVNGKRILLDCGLYQESKKESYERNKDFDYDVSTLDAVLLSHAHIDHSGNLPNLVKNGYRGPIYATSATADLTDVMLRDSAHIQEADAEFLNHHRKNGEPEVQPLYTLDDALKVTDLLRPVNYNGEFQVVEGVNVRFVDAGHILGSAAIVLDVEEQDGRKFRFWYSGDIGRRAMPLLRDPVLPEKVDYLMMECTYGDERHRSPLSAFEQFRQVLVETVKRGGKVIVPAFAVGRTQELVYYLNQAIHEGDVPAIPVYVDSPLAVEASQVFLRHPECFDDETREFVRSGHHPALDFEQLTYVESIEQSRQIDEMDGPMVIISASGMAETGRIVHHIRHGIEAPKNTIMIVSYQAPGSLGRELANHAPQVTIFGETYDVKANVVEINGLSAHAGEDLLLKYALASKEDLERVFLVHSENETAEAFRGKLQTRGVEHVVIPLLHQMVEI